MRSPDELRAFFERELRGDLETLDAERKGILLKLGIVAAILGQAVLIPLLPAAHCSALGPLFGLAFVAALTGFRAARHPAPTTIQSGVKTFILGIVLLDAGLVWIAAGPSAALVVATLLVPAAGLGRFFKMT